eukprot:scaffold1007_cov324-Pavlova_lutheri.AAC.7
MALAVGCLLMPCFFSISSCKEGGAISLRTGSSAKSSEERRSSVPMRASRPTLLDTAPGNLLVRSRSCSSISKLAGSAAP